MNIIHSLITKEIQDEVKRSVGKGLSTPMYDLVIYTNEPPKISKPEDTFIDDQHPALFAYRFAPYPIKKGQVNEFLSWMSGVVLGAITTAKA